MHIQFAELPVADPARAIRFYTENLGCRVAADAPMGPDGWRGVELGFAGADTTLHFVRRAADAPGDMPVLVLVDDDDVVAATVARLEAHGVEILAAPHNPPWQPGRTMAEFRDSEGNRMVLGSK